MVRIWHSLVLLFAAGSASAAVLRVPQDHPTIQAAVDAAGAGDVVRIKAGTYPELVFVNAKPNLTILGVGTVVIDGGNAVQPAVLIDQSDGFVMKNVRVRRADLGVYAEDTSDITLIGLRITQVAIGGIFVKTGARARIEGCIVDGGTHEAIRSADTHTLIAKCVVPKSTGSGIVLFEGPAACIGNKVSNTAAEGIVAIGSRTVLEKNVVKDAGGTGILVTTGAEFVLRANKVTGAGADGIRASAGQVVLDRNVVVNSAEDGIDAEGDALKVVQNTIKKSADVGLRTGAGGVGITLLANRVRQSGSFGFSIAGSDVVLAENVGIDNAFGLSISASNYDQFNNDF